MPPARPELTPAAVRRQLAVWARFETTRVRLSDVLSVCDAFGVIGFAWGVSHLVTVLFDGPRQIATLLWPMMVTVLSLSLRAGLTVLGRRLNLAIARGVVSDVRLGLMDKALAGRIGDVRRLNSLFEDTEALEGYYARFRQASVQAGLFPPVLLLVIAWQSPVSAGILLLTLVPFIAMMAVLGLTSAAEARRQLDALARLSNLFVDRIKALPLIFAFANGPAQTGAVGRAAHDVAERTLRVLKVAFLTSAVLEFFSALSVALIAVYCGFYLLGQLPFPVPEHLTLAKAFFVLALSPEVYAPMRRLSAAYHDRQTATAAAERLMTIETSDAVAAMTVPAAPVIRFDAVTCGFADDPEFRIGPVSFIATPGTITVLAGLTGSGKTTLLRLLAGEGRLIGGAVTVDGRPMSDLSAAVGWVSQHPPILAGTLDDNIRLARRDVTQDNVRRVIAMTGLDAVRAARTGTRLDERGSGLSGGERKRIGLARALLKDPPVLLLDEPTADLDGDAEEALIAVIQKAAEGRTVILSSHSPRLIAVASQVVTLS